MAARSCIAWSENTLESSLQFMGAAMSTSFATKPKSSTPNKNKNNREKLKLIGLGSIFFAATQAFLPIGVPTKGYQFGFHVQIFSILAPLCKYVLAQGAVVARFGRNFTTSLFGFCSSWVQGSPEIQTNILGSQNCMVKIWPPPCLDSAHRESRCSSEIRNKKHKDWVEGTRYMLVCS